MMKKIITGIVFFCVLLAGAIVCAIRWQAWFGNPTEPEWTEPTITHQFITFDNDSVLAAMQHDTLSFLLLGDIHNSVNQEDWAQLAIHHPNAQFIAQLGDWMERPYFYYEQLMYQSILGTGLEGLPIATIPGNHEHLKGLKKHLPEHWKNIFPNPKNGPARFLGTSYYMDFPQLRLIAIDTDGLFCLSDYTQVVFWLKNALRGANDRFTIVMMHHPVYSTAQGRSNPMMWLAFHGAMREADVVFSGHDHNYVRRIEQYKARFWKKEEPTVFIGTNASHKVYPNKKRDLEMEISHPTLVKCFSGEPVYQYIKISKEELYISTYKLKTFELLDEVRVYSSNYEL